MVSSCGLRGLHGKEREDLMLGAEVEGKKGVGYQVVTLTAISERL